MRRIALVQNQSEMAHYGYADARPLLEEWGFSVALYTADNIHELRFALERKQFEGILFASNALNDKTIRSEINEDKFSTIFSDWLKTGKGVVCLHQLKLATLPEQEAKLNFLPKPWNEVSACARPTPEPSADGKFLIPPGAAEHVAMLFPNRIDVASITNQCLSFRSLPGLYWHYWEEASLTDWDILIADSDATDSARPLILTSKQAHPFRIVISSLTLDWQKQISLLYNLMIFAVEGRHTTCFLVDHRRSTPAFDFLIGTLEARRFPFRRYLTDENLDRLNQHIVDGVHSFLVLGPFLQWSDLPEALRHTAQSRIQAGKLQVLTVEQSFANLIRFSLTGRERYSLQILQEAEIGIQAELLEGYIDGSFWSTAETLQIIANLPQRTTNYDRFIDRALSKADEHDRSGSYDEVFGVSCAFLWMRARYLGIQSEKTQKTVRWIREKCPYYEHRERVLAYTIFNSLEILKPQEKQELSTIVSQLSDEKLSEIDLIVYLRAAIIVKDLAAVSRLVRRLEVKQVNGAWIDLATTATGATALMDALKALRDHTEYHTLRPLTERMILAAIVHIQDAYERSLSIKGTYPWDGKASTTVKCLEAWFRFDSELDLPVYEVVETLERRHYSATRSASAATALSVLEDLKLVNSRLSSDLAGQSNEVKRISVKLRRLVAISRWLKLSYIGNAFLVYAILALLVAVVLQNKIPALVSILKTTFIDAWAFHATVGGLLAGYLALPWREYLGLESRNEGSENNGNRD